MIPKIEAIIFDMDGVLFDTERICADAWKEAARIRQVEGDVDSMILKCIGLNNNDTKAMVLQTLGADFPYDELHDLCSQVFHEIVERDGLPVKTGVRELLSYLKEEGYRIGLASSSRKASVLSHLNRAGLTDYFESITGGDMVEHSKPLPDIYLIACDSLGVAPKRAIAIEDSPNGIRSAYAAGMLPVMVPDMIEPTPEIEALLYRECNTLLDVIELLKNPQDMDKE